MEKIKSIIKNIAEKRSPQELIDEGVNSELKKTV